MRPLVIHSSLPPSTSPPPPVPINNPSLCLILTNLPKKALTLTLSLSLSITLSLAAPSPPSLSLPLPPPPLSVEYCHVAEDAAEEAVVTDRGLVEEAWDIVSEGFLDARVNRQWSPESWLQKKEDILSTSIQTRSKAHDIIKRMLASLGDPYTRFLSPSEFSKMARYDMTGIGINLKEISDYNGYNGALKLKVMGLILDGPAHAAGVRQGDEVLAVNGVDVGGKSAFEVSSMIQGPNETFVTIKVKHGNCGPVQSIHVQRQLVARTPVLYRLEENGNSGNFVGYVRLKEFNALARKDLLIAIKRLKDMGASSFILDLRDNRGGLVQEGIEVAKLFLEEGETIISTVGRDPLYQNNIAADTAPVITAPVIVLVNQNTASASEIVASALHDNCKAVLVGDRTFGKGLIQSVFELHDGSGIVVTVGKYVTPKHMDINGHGIDPDFHNLPAWTEVEKQLSKCHAQQHG